MSRSSSAHSAIRVAAPYNSEDEEQYSSTSGDDIQDGDSQEDDDFRSTFSAQDPDGVRATVGSGGRLLVISGLERSSPRSSTSPAKAAIAQSGDLMSRSHSDRSKTSQNGRASDDEPNERGLYSKAYTLRHPETTWVHRGQGLYLPESEVATLNRERSPRKRSADDQATDETLLPRSSKRQRSSTTRYTSPGRDSMTSSRTQSPVESRKRDSGAGYGLRQRYAEQEPSAAERREARMLRRSTLPVPELRINDGEDVEHDDDGIDADDDEDEDIESSEDDGDQDINRTYQRAYVDAHPDLDFKHVGNGFYRRVFAHQNGETSHRSSRRNSEHKSGTAEHNSTNKTLSTIHEVDQDSKPPITQASHATRMEALAVRGSVDASEDEGEAAADQSFSKAEMLEYKRRHPDAIFVHRGNGRYKRTDAAAKAVPQAIERPIDQVTYSKAYVESHPEFDFYHCGGGRYKRKLETLSARTRPLETRNNQRIKDETSDDEAHDADDDLFPASGSQTNGNKESLYDKDYVDKHPDETFHHRGQGRWARGLPPPGSGSKMAVRGPGAKLVKSLSNSSVETQKQDLPEHGALYRKDEGPLKWPSFDWTYRGGGKWVLSTKNAASRRARRTAQASRHDLVDHDQSELESTASTSRRGSINGLDNGRPRFKRTRSALQSIEAGDETDTGMLRSLSASPVRVLALEEDMLSDSDLPNLYLDKWFPLGPDDTDDEATHILRNKHRPLNDPDLFVRAMTKHVPATRPTETLYRLAEHMQEALSLLQDEYLELDKITAPHARIARKVAAGGRMPADPLVFEDRKEADLYNYSFDPKRIGFQDPVAQQIPVDVDGRGLRKRRKRNEIDMDAGAQLSEEAPLGRRVTKAVQRFDGNPHPQSRRPRSVVGSRNSATPDPMVTPEKRTAHDANGYIAPSSGRWANHVPKRIRELRGNSVGPGKNEATDDDRPGSDDEAMIGDTPLKRETKPVLMNESPGAAPVLASIEEPQAFLRHGYLS